MPFLARPDGCRLHYQTRGPAGGSPLLLLGGLGGDLAGWRRNIPRLAGRHAVIALDSRGNGMSDKPDEPISMATLSEDALALLDALGHGTAHVYGQSLGGMVGIELALRRPDRVRSLVLAATHAGPRRASRVGPAGNVPKDRPHLALYSERFATEHPLHIAQDIQVGARTSRPAHAGRRQWEAMQEWDAWDRLRDIACPVLVLHGTGDRLVSVENARRLARAIPGAELALLEGAGHVYHSEQPDAADRAVLDFLDRVEGRE